MINLFASTPDPDYPGHLLLEQYQAQVWWVTEGGREDGREDGREGGEREGREGMDFHNRASKRETYYSAS